MKKIAVLMIVLLMSFAVREEIFAFGPRAYTTTGLVALGVTGVTVGVGVLTSKSAANEKDAEKVAQFMRSNHGVLVHDISQVHGPMIEQWANDLHFKENELTRFQLRLEGSEEQHKMLSALKGEIDADDAVMFSKALVIVLNDTIGADRVLELSAGAITE